MRQDWRDEITINLEVFRRKQKSEKKHERVAADLSINESTALCLRGNSEKNFREQLGQTTEVDVFDMPPTVLSVL